jgi:hypothetical protein|nr:MAG TPA: Nucleotide modification associated domain 1 [Caudoviricetes sp.]
MKVNPINMKEAHDELLSIFEKKNADYGNSFEESLEKHGIIAAIVRMEDKIGRLNSLTKKGTEQKVSDESLVDTLKDLSNYALMTAVWLEDGTTSSKTDQPLISEWRNLGPDGANLKSIIQDLNRIIPGIAIGDGFILDNKSFPKSVSFATKYKKNFQHWFDSYVKDIPYYNVVYQDLGEGYTQICIYSYTEGYNVED